MPQRHMIRRAIRRLVQLYSDAAKANAAHGHIPLATGPFGPLDESRRLDRRQPPAGDRTGARHR
ncbi:hypothetical protein ACWD6P_10530 [Streptomyces sp. NPDC002446]